MKFFIPHAEDTNQGSRVYSGIKDFLGNGLNATFSDRKIFSLSYTHNGQKLYAEVGKIDPLEGEEVIAILYEPGRRLYHICTPNRGVIRGMSILAGESDVRSVVDFEH